MESLPDWDALQRCVAGVTRAATGYTTNFFAARDTVARWCATAPLRALIADRAVLILRDDRGFSRVYHVAEDAPALTAALNRLPPGTYTTDLVGRGETLNRVCAACAAAGFAHHAFLRRLVRTQEPGTPGGGGAEVAEPGDAPSVAALLERLLDPLTEQLPDPAELAEAAGAGRLLVVRHAAELAGMLMYDMKGTLAHLRFWHVDHDARGAGVGRTLMRSFMSRCAHARRIVLWVIGDNDHSIAIYRHYGFTGDGMLDRIMTLHKDRPR